ncbi:PREDICTED: uncharacterized protein LOC106344668 [Brassica oleracea var. oleracea]|uniref:uncharacterized protein LOC106344668 n=1 Tax=Brassica oleracea var. oleracea TaxID=109376 RepID=UPI0006A74391|nr:PREDICTED: uncharacterized protein LOC106344668 [Brassica oleracea var. oleracea]
MEVNSGSSTSFWFDKWSQLGVLINLTGERGCIRLGIPINATVERVVHTYRRRRHRSSVLMQIEQEILSLQEHGLGQQDDICLWMRENGEFRPGFMTSQTWNLTRTHAPRVPWFNGIWLKEATPKWLRFTTATETRDHLFFECVFSEEIWRGTISGLAGQGITANVGAKIGDRSTRPNINLPIPLLFPSGCLCHLA